MQETAKNSGFSLKALAHQMESLSALEARITGKEPDAAFLAQAKSARAGIFRLIVVGEIKKGKSSFINALTGIRDLVPVHSDVATSTIYKIHYGKELRYTAYFESATGLVPRPISKAEIGAYGTEDGNPDNRKQVDFIRVEAPSPILNNGLVIVDTPGVGGLFKRHRAITFKHAPNADAVFFVTDSVESPIGADEVSFLKELRGVTPLVYFVQTKAFSVDVAARAARMQNNLDILRRDAAFPKEQLNYFIIDSNMKLDADEARSAEDLVDSGFPPLMLFLNNNLRGYHERKIGHLALERSSAKLALCDSELNARLAVLNAGTKEEMDQLEAAINKQRDALKSWDSEIKPRLLGNFQKGLSALRREASEKIAEFRAGGSFHQQGDAAIFEAPDVESVQALVGAAASNLPAAVSKACLITGGEITDGVKRLMQKLSEEAGFTQTDACSSLIPDASTGDISISTDALKRLVERERAGQTFDNLRTTAYGGMAGVAVAGMVGGLLGSVVPVVGTMIGSTLGMMIAGAWGAQASMEIKRGHELEAVRREASAALAQSLSNIHYEAQKAVERIFEEVQSAATEALQHIVRDATGRLGGQNQDLQKRRHSSQAEVTRKRQELSVLTTEAKSLRAAFDAARASI